MLNPHESAMLMPVCHTPDQFDMNRAKFDALPERQLVMLEHGAPAADERTRRRKDDRSSTGSAPKPPHAGAADPRPCAAINATPSSGTAPTCRRSLKSSPGFPSGQSFIDRHSQSISPSI